MTVRRLAPAAILGVAVLATTASAEDPPKAPPWKLVKDGGAWKHPASGTAFTLPDGWDAGEPRKLPDRGVSAALRKDEPRMTATLYWVPLGERKWEEIVSPRWHRARGFGIEHFVLTRIYGPDKVGKPEAVKVGGREVFKIPVESGPDKDGKLVGVLYVFPVGKEENRYRVKLRASYPKEGREEHAKLIEGLLRRFELPK